MKYYVNNKIIIISILTVKILSFNSQKVFGQIFSNEQNPLSVKWRTISSDGFKIIYPSELENEAQRMANTLPYIYPRIGSGYHKQKTSTPILLQNRGTIANGFVQLAPKKSEFYTTPPQYFDSQDWLNNLAVHELRHVAQFDKLTNSKKPFLAEDIYFAWMGASIPLWFFEGDAVVNETALTNSGRGRQANWIMPYRTSLLEGKPFSYSKAYLGSSKDVTPGYYQIGYLMMANFRKTYGKFFSDSLLSDIRKKPLRIYPFSQSLKSITGKNTKANFLITQTKIKSDWEQQNTLNPTEEYRILNKPSKFATNYFLPTRINNNTILALKESKAVSRCFVLIDSTKKEHKLLSIAYQEQPWFSYANNILVWDEIRYDPRYQQRTYSVVCSYNLKTKQIKKLSSRSRVFSPSISVDGKKIIAVQVDLSNRFNLIELDAATGKVLKTYPNPENLILQTPSFDQTGERIAYISVSEKGKALWLLQQSGKKEKILAETRQQLSRPIFIGNNIAFNAHYNGIDNIYEVSIENKKINALTSAKYGAFNPSITANGNIVFNTYKKNGYEIAEKQHVLSEIADNHFVYFGTEAEKQEDTKNAFDSIPTKKFDSKPYHQLSSPINFHSLIPTLDNDNNTYGLKLQSNNLLNTIDFDVNAKYHTDLNRFEYATNLDFKALYPIFTVLYRNRPKRSFYSTNNVINQGDWRENFIKLNVGLPLSFNALNHSYTFSANVATSFTKRYAPENLPTNFITTINFPMEYNFGFTHSLRTAERDIAPRWSQTIRLTYNHQPFDKNLNGEIFAFESFFYTPGLAKNHTLLASFNYQNASGVNRFAQEISTVYGYNNIKAISTLKNTLLFNYRFPFAFPDAELDLIAYIRDLRGGIFAHYENIFNETTLAQPKTYGLELRSHLNLLRYLPIFDVGARVVFVNKIYNQNPIFEFNFNYNF